MWMLLYIFMVASKWTKQGWRPKCPTHPNPGYGVCSENHSGKTIWMWLWKHVSNRSWDHQPWANNNGEKKPERSLISSSIPFDVVLHEIFMDRFFFLRGRFLLFELLQNFLQRRKPSWRKKLGNRRRVSDITDLLMGHDQSLFERLGMRTKFIWVCWPPVCLVDSVHLAFCTSLFWVHSFKWSWNKCSSFFMCQDFMNSHIHSLDTCLNLWNVTNIHVRI